MSCWFINFFKGTREISIYLMNLRNLVIKTGLRHGHDKGAKVKLQN